MKDKGETKRIVYTYGAFDLFHRGHVELLKDAKALGDELVVGIFTDEVVESFKRKPIIPLKDRMHVVEHCRFVDRVVVQEDLAPDRNIKNMKPHVLAKGPGAGWGEGSNTIPGKTVMEGLGGAVVELEYHDGISTSHIITRIQER